MRLLRFVLNLLCIVGFGFATALPARAQATADVEIGDKIGAAYHGGDIDTVSITNGGLSVNIPLLSYPQRGGKLHLDLSFRYYSPNYTTTTTDPCVPPAKPCPTTKFTGGPGGELGDYEAGAGVGPWTRYALPGWNPPQYFYLPQVTSPDGGVHSLGLTSGNIWRSLDVTGYRYDGTAGVLTAPDGVRYAPGCTGTILSAPPCTVAYPYRADPNGNQITFGSTGETDTLGRGIPTPPLFFEFGSLGTDYSNCTGSRPLVNETTWALPGLNGGTYNLKFCYANVNIQQGACGAPGIQCLDETKQFVQSIVLPNGTAWTFEYADGSATLTQITRPTGGTISYTWTELNPCASHTYRYVPVTRTVSTQDGTSPNGTWQYSHTVNSGYSTLTTVVTDPLGNDTVHQASTVGAGNYCSYYDATVQHYNGSQTSGKLLRTEQTSYTSYPAPDIYPDFTRAFGVVPTQKVVTLDNGMQSKETWSYDAGFTYYRAPTAAPYNGVSASVIYGKVITDGEYDYGTSAPGNLLRTTTTHYQAFSNSSYLVANLLDLSSSVQVTNTGGTQVAYTTYGYDEPGSPQCVCGNQTSVHRWLNTTGGYLVTNNVYDSNGRLASTTDPKGYPTTFGYSTGYAGSGPTSVTNALNQTISHTYDFNTGLLTSTSDLNQQPTGVMYDPETLRVTEMTLPDGGQENFCYSDTASEGCASSPPYKVVMTKKITSSINLVETGIVDGLGRMSQLQLNSDPSGTDYTVIAYDAAGRKASETNPYRTTSDLTYGITGYQYDALNRTTLVTRQDGSTVTTAYCGNTTLVTDEAGKWRRSTTDGLGRLKEVDEPNSLTASVNANGCPVAGDPIWVTSYGYDALNDLTSVLQGGSHARGFGFDSLKRMTSSTNPETGNVAYGYDGDNNVQTKTDARGITITYSWDKVNRMTGRTYSNGDPTVGYTYDQTTCVVVASCYNVGHMTSMTDAAGSESMAYDTMGRMWGDQRTTFGITKNFSYLYNLDGSLQQLNYPSGHSIAYGMGGGGLPVSVGDTLYGPLVLDQMYTPWGAPSMMLLRQPAREFNFYDVRLRPCWTVAALGLASPTGDTCTTGYFASPLVEMAYSWSANGNLLSSNNYKDFNSQGYNYDQVNRLAVAQGVTQGVRWSLTFGLDQWGNLNSAVGTGSAPSFTLSTDANNHISTSLFSYDAAGNETKDATNSYAWNAESEQVGPVIYYYDGRGNRVQGPNGTLYWYGPNGEVLEDMTGDYVYFHGARLLRRDNQNNLYYYFTDQVNSTRVIAEGTFTGTTLTVCYDADFYPYGGEQRFTDTCPQNYKFDGKERDAITGNDYFGARYYSSTYGRFLSPDWSSVPAPVPYANLTNPQTLNLYAFVTDNPESFTDLDGHDPPQCTSDHPPASPREAPGGNNCHDDHPRDSPPNKPDPSQSAADQANKKEANEKLAERIVMAGEAAVNTEIGNLKVNAAVALGATSAADDGASVPPAALLALSASGNYAAAGAQAFGATTGDTKDADAAAKAMTVVTSPTGFVTLVATNGNLEKAAKWAAVEGVITASPKELFHGSAVAVTAKVLDFVQTVRDAF